MIRVLHHHPHHNHHPPHHTHHGDRLETIPYHIVAATLLAVLLLLPQHLNIDDLQTELRSTVLGDRAVSLFLVEGKVTGTGDDVQRLRVRAGELSKELGISIEVTEVEIL